MAVQLSACSSCALVLVSTGCDAPLLEAGGMVGLMAALASYPTNQRLVGAPGCQPVSSTSCWTNPWKASCCRSLIGCRSGMASMGGLGPTVRTLPLCSAAICCMERCRLAAWLTAYPTDCPQHTEKAGTASDLLLLHQMVAAPTQQSLRDQSVTVTATRGK